MRRLQPEINAGSMADIAFLLLIFFLVTTTMNVDSGIVRTLPPLSENNGETIKLSRENILFVAIDDTDLLTVNEEPVELSALRERVKRFIVTDSEQEPKSYPVIGEIPVSKGVVSLRSSAGSSYARYLSVQEELGKAFAEVRDDYAMRYFGKRFDALTDNARKGIIREIVPLRISEGEVK